MSVKIFTMTHKKFETIKDPMYIPLQVGRGKKGGEDLGYLGDDSGDHISQMNCYYSELTGVYWMWKNYHESDYVGVCHYRRYLINENGRLFSEAELEAILKEYDLIATKTLELNFSYYEGYGKNHNIIDLEETGHVIKELYPEYYQDFEKIIHSNGTYFGNIMVCSKELFDQYAQWLFTIFFEVQKRIDVSSYDEYHKRVFGFISEILLKVWATKNQLKVYEGMVGMVGEKKETKELKEKLAEYFEKKDLIGAKEYFLEFREKRPDVLMEASDTTGELKLSMQVIATCEMELAEYQTCVLDTTTKFEELMAYFKMLNRIIYRYMLTKNTTEDILFLIENKVSILAIEIAVKILCTTKDAAVHTLLSMAENMNQEKKYEMALALWKRCLEYEETNEIAKECIHTLYHKIEEGI